MSSTDPEVGMNSSAGDDEVVKVELTPPQIQSTGHRFGMSIQGQCEIRIGSGSHERF